MVKHRTASLLFGTMNPSIWGYYITPLTKEIMCMQKNNNIKINKKTQ